MRLRLCYLGRAKDRALNEAAAEYARRIERFCPFTQQEVRTPEAAREKFPRAFLVALDPAGREMDSPALAHWLEKQLAGGARDLVFLVGGADGLTPAARQSADLLLSLSRLTLPHELARVVLLEQLYRALATLRGHPYAR